MAAELLAILARCNLAAGAAILAAMALRAPLRRWLGAQYAYAVWLIVPLAATGSLMPAGWADGAPGPVEAANDRALAWLSAGGHATALTFLWLGGAVLAISIAAWRHRRFFVAVEAGRAGPAAVGMIQPRLVTPTDFAERFTDEERRLVRAHERAHIDRLDARHNAAAALATCVCWFNPLLHLAVRAMRLDQELACDAMVMARLPSARRRYAETLLRTHQSATTPVLGCQWMAHGHALDARIRMLVADPPGQARLDFGLAILIGAWTAAFGVAWAIQPPARAPQRPMVILVDLARPDSADAKRDAAVYRFIQGPGRGAP